MKFEAVSQCGLNGLRADGRGQKMTQTVSKPEHDQSSQAHFTTGALKLDNVSRRGASSSIAAALHGFPPGAHAFLALCAVVQVGGQRVLAALGASP